MRALFYFLLSLPVRLLVKCKVIPDNAETFELGDNKDVFYIVRHQSASDLLALRMACKSLNMPDPLESVVVDGQQMERCICLEKPSSIFPWMKPGKTRAMSSGSALLKAHQKDHERNAKLIPANLLWGRKPGKAKVNVSDMIADETSPNFLRKFFIVLFLGRDALVRFSEPVSLRQVVDTQGSDDIAARKLIRMARIHFHRQSVATTGPRLMDLHQKFTALFANPAIKRLIKEEAKSKGKSEEEIKKQARGMMKEIAADYRPVTIRLGDRVLTWLWNRLYNGIEVKNGDRLRELSQAGHEIIYVPCHRSHMDYLLLTYVIYHQAVATPRIAAGINLNFWPAGPIFRKAGAFFIRRSFRGNRLYSTIFREYLGLLFTLGYPVKYYTEGGRSRTGRLLQPKTGMIAMTVQSMLKGIERPLTLVPVYLGYEHVMEVASYHKELKGSGKQKESVFGIIKAIRKLRNYGKGYVNFGEPISINDYLDSNVPEWKESIDPIDPPKPKWLTPTVNGLADQVMTEINKAAALNSVTLTALILLTSENKALTRKELEAQLDFFIEVQKAAPFSKEVYIPHESGKELVDSVISLNKVDVTDDKMGQLISLTDQACLEMSYYRNNILHTYMLPSVVCRLLNTYDKLTTEEIDTKVEQLMQLIKAELFLWHSHDDIVEQTETILKYFELQQLIKQSKAGYWSINAENKSSHMLNLMSSCISETVQRYTIVLNIVNSSSPIARSALESDATTLAERMSKLHNINAPEFIDRKAQTAVVNALRDYGYIETDDTGSFIKTDKLASLDETLEHLIEPDVLQSILHT
ncbi:glycerol-3-phosphate 1-O-acyltransferase PlsB [Thalassotalea sp. HSM 43]|uniref:glycerol-3-phosphate 1-O-acyltransferase PlsB n=1 Tax=Thalassotalea sp. HSM 43 TaxID=2552945 RepID=UPI001080CA36|nr:glycerol-3-phosphate 1-O-acyltransferase PlsB [Thalassotalea sp. HSM 43]QBY04085.1 glycerol-3-phosphate 1-O-acyltransferase PlsB [Thalassotalea sp. HSM 43]